MSNPMIAGLPPVHPGEVLSEDVVPASGLNKTAFAKRLGMSREAFYNVLSGKSAVSTVLALKLARMLGTSPELWLNMQQAFDLATVGLERRKEIEQVEALEPA
ncbi:MAG TPA: HigA family addiction module antitoxin [Croceibacterium sp.]|jgi:addiction module HigA family antidote|nr:HigA family addiction module antitoxin [Croceibacterium sp.]